MQTIIRCKSNNKLIYNFLILHLLFRREREGLLHKYEIDEKTKHMKKCKADPAKTIKCFSRSAAGQDMTDPYSLRPPLVLLSTIRYLFTK